MRNEICRCLDECSKDPSIRVVVLTGNPEGRAFCAGADLSPASNANPGSMEGDAPDGRSADLAHWRDGGGIAGLAVARSTKPVIAAINGAAVGVVSTVPPFVSAFSFWIGVCLLTRLCHITLVSSCPLRPPPPPPSTGDDLAAVLRHHRRGRGRQGGIRLRAPWSDNGMPLVLFPREVLLTWA